MVSFAQSGACFDTCFLPCCDPRFVVSTRLGKLFASACVWRSRSDQARPFIRLDYGGSQMRLAGKTALIAGGTTGIGLAAARLMIAEGAKVAICGQEPERLREASTALGAQAKTFRADLRSLSDIRHLAKNVGDWTDQLDILFLNAGI